MRLYCLYAGWVISTLLFFRSGTLGQVEICQENCADSNRLNGPLIMPATRSHPWKQAVFPTKLQGFCKMGCQLFFAEYPKNTTCKRMCDYYYRSRETVGYSDIVENAKLECNDGCDIAVQVCQPGFYCRGGQMTPCAPGKFRGQVKSLSIVDLEGALSCELCPPGRYRKSDRGKSPDDCTRCPIGKFANIPGSVLVSDCKRCPSGKNAEEAGMAECTCMTNSGLGGSKSCDLDLTKIAGSRSTDTRHYYLEDSSGQNVDFYRETIPYIGRW